MFIGLVDGNYICKIIYWSSKKFQRITRLILVDKVYAFSIGYDFGVSIRMLLRKMEIDVPLYLFTDSKSIFDTITASKRLRELRLTNAVVDIRRAYKDDEISSVAWIRSEHNIADNFTRLNGNDVLNEVLRSGKLNCTIEQLV